MAVQHLITPADVPAALVDVAERALAEAITGDPDTEITLRDRIRTVLAAVLPKYEHQLREKIAAEIRFPTRVVFAKTAEEAQAILDRERQADGRT